MYATDWDDYLPMSGHYRPPDIGDCDPTDPATLDNLGYGQQIYPYVKNLDLFQCPNDPQLNGVKDDLSDTCTCWNGSGSVPCQNYNYTCFFNAYGGQSYGFNPYVGMVHGPAGWNYRVTQGSLPDPVNTLVIADSSHAQGINEEYGYPGMLCSWTGACNGSRITSIHNDGANEAFADGHAKWLAYPVNHTSVIWLGEAGTVGGIPGADCLP